MATNEYDVIVVGAGPGGSTCATFLAMKGNKVLLLEKAKYPRDKTCGDAVGGKCVQIAKELNLLNVLEDKLVHAPVNGAIFTSPKGARVRLEFPEQKGQKSKGYVCRRLIYDNMLFEKAKSTPGVTIMENTLVKDLVKDGDKVTGVIAFNSETKQDLTLKAKVVVGSDGAYSVVAQKTGNAFNDDEHTCMALKAYYSGVTEMEDAIELHFVDSIIPGYFWIFPVGNGMANIGIGMVQKDLKNRSIKLKEAMLDIIENNPLFKERFKNAKLETKIEGWMLPFGSKMRTMHGNGYVLVGDAAALIDPFTGEGVGNAMTSGKIAAHVITEAIKKGDTSAASLKEYEDKVRLELGPELEASYKMQKIGKHKFLLNMLLGKASRSKAVRDALTESLSTEENKKVLSDPLFYLKLLLA